MNNEVTVIVPTYNAGKGFSEFCSILKKQTAKIQKVIIIDSSSTDKTVTIAEDAGFFVKVIDKSDFGHGKTRQMALEMSETDIVCYMTQDALLTEETSVEKLITYLLEDTLIGAVYGRQLPYPHTGVIEAFARNYNYPEHSFVNSLEDRITKGFKTAFLSDTFAAYKRDILQKVGGFPVYSNFGEDSYVAGKMILAGYKTGYCAEAKVYHAHDYDFRQEWQRSKEIKSFHDSEPWLLQTFGKPEGEGIKYVYKEMQWLIKQGFWYMIPSAIVHNAIKFIGYKV